MTDLAPSIEVLDSAVGYRVIAILDNPDTYSEYPYLSTVSEHRYSIWGNEEGYVQPLAEESHIPVEVTEE